MLGLQFTRVMGWHCYGMPELKRVRIKGCYCYGEDLGSWALGSWG